MTSGTNSARRFAAARAADPRDVADALSYISPDLARGGHTGEQGWVNMLMAIKAVLDDTPTAKAIARTWSEGSDKYCEHSFNSTWNSIDAEGGIGPGTLFSLAHENGWLGSAGGHRYSNGGKAPARPIAARSTSRPTQDPAKEKVYGRTPPGNPVAVYYYNLPNGKPHYRKVRYKTPTGKITPFQRYDAARDAWIGGEDCVADVERVLYRNEQLAGVERVFVCEGEKSADLLWDLGILAVCADSGAGHWRPAFSDALRGRDVVILPDHDDPGRGHAALVAWSLVGKAHSIKIVELPGLETKQDVYDWLIRKGKNL